MSRTRIRVSVDNRTATLTSQYPYDKLIPYWSHAVENYQHIMRARPWYRKCKVCHGWPDSHDDSDHQYVPAWDGRIKFLKFHRLPAGLFWATKKEIEKKEKVEFKIKKKIERPKLAPPDKWLVSEGEYKFQNEVVDAAVVRILSGKGGLILNATGSGKTRIAAMLASRFDCEIVFIVDQLVLLRQAREEIAKHLGEKVGFVGESKFKIRRVTVATIQTLFLHRADPKFIKWFRRVQIPIIDELHEQLNRSNFSVMSTMRPLSVIGLTATLGLSKKPVRMRSYSLCGKIIYKYSVTRGMREGVLSKGIGIILQFPNELENIKGWDRAEAYNKKVVHNAERNHLISGLVRAADKRKHYTITVVERIKHLEELSSRFEDYVKFKVVAGTFKGESIPVSMRMRAKDKFESGKIRNLLVNKVFKKGVDIKRVDVIINAAAKPSANDGIQVLGRAARIHKDKKGFICIDICDVDSLDKQRKKQNWIAVAAKKRKSAYKKAGIVCKVIQYNEDMKPKDIIKQAEKYLKEEIKNG